jgi:hypothetical protein
MDAPSLVCGARWADAAEQDMPMMPSAIAVLTIDLLV